MPCYYYCVYILPQARKKKKKKNKQLTKLTINVEYIYVSL